MKARYEFNSDEEYSKYLRIYFSAMAMRSLLSNADSDRYTSSKGLTRSAENKATFCCDMADALIKALNETE